MSKSYDIIEKNMDLDERAVPVLPPVLDHLSIAEKMMAALNDDLDSLTHALSQVLSEDKQPLQGEDVPAYENSPVANRLVNLTRDISDAAAKVSRLRMRLEV